MNERTPEQVRVDLELAREATLRSLDQVRHELIETVDWRAHYQRHTWRWLAVVAGIGLFIGYQTKQ